MSVKVHEAFSIDSFQDRLLWWDDFLGDQLKDEWDTSIAGVSTAVVVDAQTGGIVRLTTGGASADFVRIHWSDVRSLLVSKKVTIETRVKLNQTTLQRAWPCRLRFDGANQIYISHETDVRATFTIHTEDGGATTNPDSGVAVDTDYHIFRIECFPTGEVHFYIDGVETANSPITTNIGTDYYQPSLSIQTLENVAKSMDIDYVVVRQEI